MRQRFNALFIVACFLLGLSGSASAQQVFTPEETSALLKDIVSSETLPYASLQVTQRGDIFPSADNYGAYLGLQAYPAQESRNNAVSSELAINYPFREGETLRYSWRMKLPASFTSDAPDNRWWLLARWNDQANLQIGERPETFAGHNPAIMIGYRQLEGKHSLSFSYGIPQAITTIPFAAPADQWVKFCLEVTWSRGDQGVARLFVNDGKLPLREAKGPNLYTKYHTLFRLGMYRNAAIQSRAALYVGDVKIEKLAR